MAEKTVPIHLRRVPAELHKNLKVKAAQRGITMESLILELLERGIAADERKG